MKGDSTEPYDGPPPPYPGEPNMYMSAGHQLPPYHAQGDGQLQQPPMPAYGMAPTAPIQSQPTAVLTTVVGPPPVVVVGMVRFGAQSVQTTCTHCGAVVLTRTQAKPGGLTWLLCVLCCLFGCDVGCCFIPFCVNSMQDVEHYCPSCNVRLGTYNRL